MPNDEIMGPSFPRLDGGFFDELEIWTGRDHEEEASVVVETSFSFSQTPFPQDTPAPCLD